MLPAEIKWPCNMKERLKEFMVFKKLTSADLADRIGVQRSNVSHILNGRNNPGAQFLEKLLDAFPDLDANWLLTGRGAMLLRQQSAGFTAPGETSAHRGLPPVEPAVPPVKPHVLPVDTGIPSVHPRVPPAGSLIPPSGLHIPPAEPGLPFADPQKLPGESPGTPVLPPPDPAGTAQKIIIFHSDRTFTEYFPR